MAFVPASKGKVMAGTNELSAILRNELLAISNGELVIPTAQRLARIAAGLVNRDQLVADIYRAARLGQQRFVEADLDAAIEEGWTGGLKVRTEQACIARAAAEIAKIATHAKHERERIFMSPSPARAEWVAKWVLNDDPKYPDVARIQCAAAISTDLTGDEFRKIFIVTRFGGGRSENITVTNEVLADLMNTDPRGWRRAKAKIQAKGWLIEKATYRNGHRHVNAYTFVNPVIAILRGIDAQSREDSTSNKAGRVARSRLGGLAQPSFSVSSGLSVKDSIGRAGGSEVDTNVVPIYGRAR
jgi:hypothetical protein